MNNTTNAPERLSPAGLLGRVLVACEYSGSVRDAFAALGWEAWSCDILPSEKPGNHYQGDVRDILNDGWDIMVAHPPCTYLSRAGCRWLFPGGVLNQERFGKGMEARRFFEELLAAPVPHIAIENPVPHKVFGMPLETQRIQPWQHGHEAQKTTLLWLKNLPPLTETQVVSKGEYFYDKVNGWRHTKWFMSDTSAKSRSRTFAGIAKAMAVQWTNATRPKRPESATNDKGKPMTENLLSPKPVEAQSAISDDALVQEKPLEGSLHSAFSALSAAELHHAATSAARVICGGFTRDPFNEAWITEMAKIIVREIEITNPTNRIAC